MQLETLVETYRSLLRDMLHQYFGVERSAGEQMLVEFVRDCENSPGVKMALAQSEGVLGRIIVELRNYAFQRLQQGAPPQGMPPADFPEPNPTNDPSAYPNAENDLENVSPFGDFKVVPQEGHAYDGAGDVTGGATLRGDAGSSDSPTAPPSGTGSQQPGFGPSRLTTSNEGRRTQRADETIGANQPGHSTPAHELPQFSAATPEQAGSVWAVLTLAPALSRSRHRAAHATAWHLFEATRLRPLFTGKQRPSLEQVAVQLGYFDNEQAEAELAQEQAGWVANVDEQLRSQLPKQLPSAKQQQALAQQHEMMIRVMQRIASAGFEESLEQLKRARRLIEEQQETEATGTASANEIANRIHGLRIWEDFLRERVECWHEARFLYDAEEIFRVQIASHETNAGPSEDVRATTRDPDLAAAASSEQSGVDALHEILQNLNLILQTPLPIENPLFLSGPTHDLMPGITIGQVLFDSRTPERAVRFLKDLAKQQGRGTQVHWHLAVSKLIYFAAIASYLLHHSPHPSNVTTLTRQELVNAMQWGASLPSIPSQLRQLFLTACELLERIAS